MIICNFRY